MNYSYVYHYLNYIKTCTTDRPKNNGLNHFVGRIIERVILLGQGQIRPIRLVYTPYPSSLTLIENV